MVNSFASYELCMAQMLQGWQILLWHARIEKQLKLSEFRTNHADFKMPQHYWYHTTQIFLSFSCGLVDNLCRWKGARLDSAAKYLYTHMCHQFTCKIAKLLGDLCDRMKTASNCFSTLLSIMISWAKICSWCLVHQEIRLGLIEIDGMSVNRMQQHNDF